VHSLPACYACVPSASPIELMDPCFTWTRTSGRSMRACYACVPSASLPLQILLTGAAGNRILLGLARRQRMALER
jgi:hypothetical protein